MRTISEEPGFWRLSVLLQHGVKTLYTRDRDFRRYDFLKVIDPIK